MRKDTCRDGNVICGTQAATPATTADRIKPDWYQKDTTVTVTLFIKKLKKEDVTVEYTAKTLSVTIKLHTGADYK